MGWFIELLKGTNPDVVATVMLIYGSESGFVLRDKNDPDNKFFIVSNNPRFQGNLYGFIVYAGITSHDGNLGQTPDSGIVVDPGDNYTINVY